MNKKYASFINRFFSTCIDQSIYSTLFFLPFIWISTAPSLSNLISKLIITTSIYWIPISLLGFIYILFFQLKFGRTLGMLFSGNKIEDADGNRLPFSLIFYRQTIGLSISSALFCIGLLWIIKSKKKQGWHDMLVDSYVVKHGHGSTLIALLFLILFFIIQTGITYATFSNMTNSNLFGQIKSISKQMQKQEELNLETNQDYQKTQIDTEKDVQLNKAENDIQTLLDNAKISEVENLYWQGFDIWVKTKDYEKAEEYYKKALEIDPNYAPALSSYGFMLGAFHDRYAEGEAMIKKAMEIDPTWAYTPYNLGLLLSIEGKHDEGIYWVQYAVDNYPNHPDIEWFKEHLEVMKNTYSSN